MVVVVAMIASCAIAGFVAGDAGAGVIESKAALNADSSKQTSTERFLPSRFFVNGFGFGLRSDTSLEHALLVLGDVCCSMLPDAVLCS